jgi:UPF0176 protein
MQCPENTIEKPTSQTIRDRLHSGTNMRHLCPSDRKAHHFCDYTFYNSAAMTQTNSPVTVAALYRFVELTDYAALQAPLLAEMERLGLYGTLLLAREGINGTVAGVPAGIEALITWLQSAPVWHGRLSGLDVKLAHADGMPFARRKVKLKKEIVTMGVEGIDPRKVVGTYVEAKDWNALISDPEVTVIDTRNSYETQIGTFHKAVTPGTDSFREFPAFVKNNLSTGRHRKIAMFCTGGIRCEKSTAYLKEQGFDEVYHLQGGILKYLETVPEDESLWQGECFVFDNRVAVNHALEQGSYSQCHACRMPITEEDKASEHFYPGVSCPHCIDKTTEQQRLRFAERHKQIELARSRGEDHIGSIKIEKR